MDRLVKGIWIPIEIWQDQSLSWNEKILLMEIDSFTSKSHECFISNEYIANLLGVSERCASKYLSHLIDVGYVRMVRFDGRRRFVESTIQFQAEWNDCSMQGGQNVPHTDNKNNIYTLSIKGNAKFKKPSLDEIRDYCTARGNSVDPEQFYNFYESKGWMVGKSPMKDWKASVRTWEKRDTAPAPKRRSPRRESVLEHNLKVMDEMYGTDIHKKVYGDE